MQAGGEQDDLERERAAAVVNALCENYGIDAHRVRSYCNPELTAAGASRTAVEFSAMDHIALSGETIGFHPMSSVIEPGSCADVLQQVAEMMLEDPSLVVQVEGHTDDGYMPGSTTNLELSQKRAESVVQVRFFVKQGFALNTRNQV